MESRKSEIKSFRLDAGTLKRLRIVARREKVTENAFVQNLLSQRVKADPLIRAFPYIVLSRRSFLPILSAANPDVLEVVGIELGRSNFALIREIYASVGKEIDFVSYLTDVLEKEAQWFEVEGTEAMPERLTLRHEYGTKWSLFLKSFLTGAYEVVSHQKLTIRTDSMYVSLEIPKATR